MTPFFFDFSFDSSKLSDMLKVEVAEPKQPATSFNSDNLCPYPIPTVDEIIKDLDRYSLYKGKVEFLSDIFECGAIAISNMVDKVRFDEREKRYLQIINTYPKEQQQHLVSVFAKIYALLSSVVYDNGVFNDYLGDIFMRSNSGNKNCGQFFTPYHVSKFMAYATLLPDMLQEKKEQNEILTVNDCCCGGGGLMIAALDVLKENKFNYAYNCFVDCGDIDLRCVHMTYLQLSLAGVPAVVHHQNALTREQWSVWLTPALIFQYPRFQRFINLK